MDRDIVSVVAEYLDCRSKLRLRQTNKHYLKFACLKVEPLSLETWRLQRDVLVRVNQTSLSIEYESWFKTSSKPGQTLTDGLLGLCKLTPSDKVRVVSICEKTDRRFNYHEFPNLRHLTLPNSGCAGHTISSRFTTLASLDIGICECTLARRPEFPTQLQKLVIRGSCNSVDLPIDYPPNLTSLEIYPRYSLRPVEIRQFPTTLTHLGLKITHLSPGIFDHLTNLRSLTLRHPQSLRPLENMLSRLTKLSLETLPKDELSILTPLSLTNLTITREKNIHLHNIALLPTTLTSLTLPSAPHVTKRAARKLPRLQTLVTKTNPSK